MHVERLTELIQYQHLERIRIARPFFLRSIEPAPSEFRNGEALSARRLGERIVIEFRENRFAMIHLMIAGRLRWRKLRAALPRGAGLAAFDFSSGTMLVTEASSQRRASLHLVESSAALSTFDRGGLEVLHASYAQFRRSFNTKTTPSSAI